MNPVRTHGSNIRKISREIHHDPRKNSRKKNQSELRKILKDESRKEMFESRKNAVRNPEEFPEGIQNGIPRQMA